MLPVYKCVINPDDESPLEVQAVALVDRPAIEKNFLAFKEQKPLTFALDEARHIISGPAMLADTPIYRNDESGEYLVVFDKQTIEKIVEKFFAKGLMMSFNIMHSPDNPAPDTCIFESFISDTTRGIQPMKGFEDCPDGSWFISAKVNDPGVWEKVKSGEVKGFSVEGLFKMMPVKMAVNEIITAEQVKKMTDEQKMKLIKLLLNETD